MLHDSTRQDLQEVSCISCAVAGNDKLSCMGALTTMPFSHFRFQLQVSVFLLPWPKHGENSEIVAHEVLSRKPQTSFSSSANYSSVSYD